MGEVKEQLNLFSQIQCDHCNANPGFKPANPILWNGFIDQDTRQHVCWFCRDKHYRIKKGNKPGTTYSEVPVMLNQFQGLDRIEKPPAG